jgi:hypothetical protein
MLQVFKMKLVAVLTFWLIANCMTALSASPSAPKVSSSAAAGSRPNVIVLMTDDQGYGEFSIHGNPIAHTPNIDRLEIVRSPGRICGRNDHGVPDQAEMRF